MFSIKKEDDTVVLAGRFDASQQDAAREMLATVTQSAVLDFSELSYISSAGLGILLATQKRLMSQSAGLKLVNLNPHIREIFTMAGFDRIFEIE